MCPVNYNFKYSKFAFNFSGGNIIVLHPTSSPICYVTIENNFLKVDGYNVQLSEINL